MDLQAAQAMKGKRSTFSRLTVAFCLMLTAALLISSLVSPSRAGTSFPTASISLPS
jgi:hypothetical protein